MKMASPWVAPDLQEAVLDLVDLVVTRRQPLRLALAAVERRHTQDARREIGDLLVRAAAVRHPLGTRELVWAALAMLQTDLEQSASAPTPPGSAPARPDVAR